jgi:hypothetical protein
VFVHACKEQQLFTVKRDMPCIYTVVLCDGEEFKYNASRRTYCWGYAMQAVIHLYNYESLKDMPDKQQIKQQIVGVM